MGKLYKVQIASYNGNTLYDTGVIGIPYINTQSQSLGLITNDFTAFFDYVDDWIYLGCSYYTTSTMISAYGTNLAHASNWFPLCNWLGNNDGVASANHYGSRVRLIFENGYYLCIDDTNIQGYDDHGVKIFDYDAPGTSRAPYMPSRRAANYPIGFNVMGVNAADVNPDGTFDVTSRCAIVGLGFEPDYTVTGGIVDWGPMNQLATFFNACPSYSRDKDPYEEVGDSEPGGYGDGTFDFTSTDIDFQGVPSIGAYNTGMISMYVPSAAQLGSLSSYLWAGAFDPDNFKKLVADPMDTIIGLSIVPLTAAQIGTTGATLMVGNISTGLSMPKATSQYVVVDCGSVSVLPKYGAYLDYAPYAKLQLFLPYIGYINISPDDVMGSSIAVKYTVDILSGTCVAQVKCGGHVLYEMSGSCSCACPVTAGQYQNIALTALRTVGSIAGMVAAPTPAGIAGGLEDVANSVIASAKPDVQRSGGFGGSSGLMGHQIPYLILTIPKMCKPGDQNKYIGYPSYVTTPLDSITGYVEIDAIHLTAIPGASDDDIQEIDSLLKSGVFL